MTAPRLVLVTGAAGAIGSALALGLAARFPDAHLALSDVDDAGLARVAAGQAHPRSVPGQAEVPPR